MKKRIYAIVILILIIIISLSFILIRKILTPIPEINFDNSCETSNDCKLKKLHFSCACNCNHIVNFGKRIYVSVNAENYYEYYSNWKKENCTNEELEKICVCPSIATQFINEHYDAVCDSGQCIKRK